MSDVRPPIVLWKWRSRRRGDVYWRRLGWMMTEEHAQEWAAREHHDIERIAGTAEVRQGHYPTSGGLMDKLGTRK